MRWNKGKVTGAKPPLRLKDVWSIRTKLEVHLNLAYRWFCRVGLDGDVPDHSTFSKNRHGRFRDSDLLRHVFETGVRRCMAEGLVGGSGFARWMRA